jgi:hypothetical protein
VLRRRQGKIRKMIAKAKNQSWEKTCSTVESYLGGKRCTEAWSGTVSAYVWSFLLRLIMHGTNIKKQEWCRGMQGGYLEITCIQMCAI